MLILCEHERFLTFNVEKPAWESTVHDTFFRAWVEGIFVLDVFNLVNDSLLLENFGDEFVAGPDLDAVLVGVAHAEGVEFVGVFLDVIAILI